MRIKYQLPTKNHPQHEDITLWTPTQFSAFVVYLREIHGVEDYEFIHPIKGKKDKQC